MSDINGVMIQYFHWYIPTNGTHWKHVQNHAEELKAAGFTAVWLPPAYKGIGGPNDVGYAVYDMYDLGEFKQHGSIRTKYGTREQYLEAVKALQQNGLQVYADAVLNHRIGGDSIETVWATPFPQENRLHPKGEIQRIQTYTHFHFPNRKHPNCQEKPYSSFEWHWYHFDAVDYNACIPDDYSTIYLLENKTFDDYVALEKGNYAYLMGCDLDYQSSQVRDEITHWGEWYLDTTGVDGFRLDAIKHISAWFFPEWMNAMKQRAGKDLFMVGEYWVPNLDSLLWYIDAVDEQMSVFDVCLHYNFHFASITGGSYDMRHILDGTVMCSRPTHAVTFVENHDSQPLQKLESPVEPWFKPLAYALILLRREGYPCVFYADYYGADYQDPIDDYCGPKIHLPSHRWLIDKFLYARRHYAYGEQYDYFDHCDRIGWTRLGNAAHPQAMAVLMSNGPGGSKWMEVGKANTCFIDITEHCPQPVYTNEHGWGEFFCPGGSVSVWIEA